MSIDPQDIVEIRGLERPVNNGEETGVSTRAHAARPWIAVHWRCCHVYSRLYRNRQATAYTGSCPKCLKPARALIDPSGSPARFFMAE